MNNNLLHDIAAEWFLPEEISIISILLRLLMIFGI